MWRLLTKTDIVPEKRKEILIPHIFSAFLIKTKSQSFHLIFLAFISPSTRLPAPSLPDGAFDTRPDRALGLLCGSYVVPVQPGAGDLVLGLRVGSCPVFRSCHHQGQRGSLRLKLDNVELLLVGQRLVGFLQEGIRTRGRCKWREVRKRIAVTEQENFYIWCVESELPVKDMNYIQFFLFSSTAL